MRTFNYILYSILLDSAAIIASLLIAISLRFSFVSSSTFSSTTRLPIPVIFMALFVWLTTFFVMGVYDPRTTRRAIDELQTLLVAALFAFLTLAGLLFFSYRDVSRLFIIYFYILTVGLLVGWRFFSHLTLRAWRNRGSRYQPRRIIIVGNGEIAQEVYEQIKRHQGSNAAVLGLLSNEAEAPTPNLPVLGSLDEAHRVVDTNRVEEVIVALADQHMAEINQVVRDLQTLPITLRIFPNYLNLALYRATVENYNGIPLINLRSPAFTPYQRLTKRIFDIAVGGPATLLTLPVMAITALAIRLDSPGPVIFRQKRAGENGRVFTMYKFRSMHEDAEERLKDVMRQDENGNLIHKIKDDPRITRVGHFIRRTSIDELPQLFNVLKGDMSLVGPRPELPMLVEQYELWQRKRFAVPQGITGWWQINGRSDKPMHLYTEEDLYYIQNYSILLDIWILWKTIAAVFKRTGAY